MGYQWPIKSKRRLMVYPPKQKYGAVRTNGMGSKLEAAVYQILLLREKAGEITDIQKQARVHLSCQIYWKVDFSFMERGTMNRRARRVYCEAKGVETERYRICLKLWTEHGPGPLEIWKGSWQQPKLYKIVEVKRNG